MEYERWKLADVDDNASENQHVQHLMKVRMGIRQGIGVLEQFIFGPYDQLGHIAPVNRHEPGQSTHSTARLCGGQK